MTHNSKKSISEFYNQIAPRYDRLKQKNAYYHHEIEKLYSFLIPKRQKVLEIGCATGDLLGKLDSVKSVGIDPSRNMITIAKKKFPHHTFKKAYGETFLFREKFDYIILSDVVGSLDDIQRTFTNLHKNITNDSRIIISFYNYIWEPVLTFATKVGLKAPQPHQSWLTSKDIVNLLALSNFEVIKSSKYLLLPIYIPFFSSIINKYVSRLPLIRELCFVHYIVARKQPLCTNKTDYSVSLILPARNEAGNIQRVIHEIPDLGKKTELIFIEGHSNDNTRSVIKKAIETYRGTKRIKYYIQKKERGKGAAVRLGMKHATGDILIIFDTDLSTDPQDLPKFYEALRDGKADFIQGSRLVYPMEKEAMRFLNVLGNKFFSIAFSFLLDQPIKDTLCGTKLLFRENYERIAQNRSYFGDFDPFGDFDMIFGSAKLNLKLAEIPIRYKARTYGETNIKRFRNGLILLRMTVVAAKKIKFF